jgi:hypothetical protein
MVYGPYSGQVRWQKIRVWNGEISSTYKKKTSLIEHQLAFFSSRGAWISRPPWGETAKFSRKIHGAEEGIRTLDPRLGKAMLYR